MEVNKLSSLVAVLFLSVPVLVFAGSFRAVPVKIYLDAQSRVAVLTILNEGDTKVSVQLSTRRWDQDETGQDIYEDTDDLLFFPRIADIEKGEERIIRVGYEGKATNAVEQTYRLYISELPVQRPGEVALKLAIRLGIPVFVAPQEELKEWGIDGITLAEESISVRVRNSGNSHVSVSKITAIGQSDSGEVVFSQETNGWYALAGVTKTFALDVPREECLRTNAVRVLVEVEQVTQESSLKVEESMCAPRMAGLGSR